MLAGDHSSLVAVPFMMYSLWDGSGLRSNVNWSPESIIRVLCFVFVAAVGAGFKTFMNPAYHGWGLVERILWKATLIVSAFYLWTAYTPTINVSVWLGWLHGWAVLFWVFSLPALVLALLRIMSARRRIGPTGHSRSS